MTPSELEKLVAEKSATELLDAMCGLSEKERRALAPTALRLEKHCSSTRYSLMAIDVGQPDWRQAKARAAASRERHSVARAALLATGSASELMRRGDVFDDLDHAARALGERQPPWLDGLAETLIAQNVREWPICYRLVTAGLCRRPTSENWCLGFLAGGRGWVGFYSPVNKLEEHFSDPIFVERELWRLFEIEGTQQLSFSNADRSWSTALLAHAAAGAISKGRLLDATLDALQRDFSQTRARWFDHLHRDLQPSIDERVARLDRYLALLASRIPTTVTFALDALVEIEQAGRLPSNALLAHLAPALQARTKKTALAVLAFAERAAVREPQLARTTATLGAEALSHEVADVQARAIALVIRFGDRSDRALSELVRDRGRSTAPTLRPKLLDWLGEPAASAHTESEPAVVPRVSGVADRPLRRAQSLDEAIDLLSGAIERFDDPDEMEAALDGVARFCGERPPDFAQRIAPLAKRAVRLLDSWPQSPFTGRNLRRDLCLLALGWSGNLDVEDGDSERCMRTLLAGRIREVALRAARARPTTLLATPTHRDGWIDSEVVVQRALTAAPDPLDAVQSLLRIAREGRRRALSLSSGVQGEYGAALRFALGGPRPADTEGDLWLAAEAACTSADPPPSFDLLRHNPETTVEDNTRKQNETLLMRWAATVFPADLRIYFQAGSAALVWNLEWAQALWWNSACLEPLLRPDVTLEPTATRLLAVALAAKQPIEGGLATDVLIQVIWDGRAKAEHLGDSFSDLLSAEIYRPALYLTSGGVIPHHHPAACDCFGAIADGEILSAINCARWAKRLQEVSRASSQHASFVRDLIERALRRLPAKTPRDLGPLLALLRELCVETSKPLRDPEARAKLASISGSGAAARVARALLAEASTGADDDGRRTKITGIDGRKRMQLAGRTS